MTSRYGRITGLVGLGLALGAGLAQAQGNLNARLNGDYAFSQSRSCVEVAGTLSFDPVTFQIVSSGAGASLLRRFTTADRGTIRYNGDGTGSATVVGSSIDMGSGTGFPASQFNVTCQIAYTVNADDTVDHHADCSSTTTAGGGVGNTTTVTGIRTKRRIVQGNTAILHGPAEPPVIESVSVTVMSGPNFFPTRERICVRSGISSKLSGR